MLKQVLDHKEIGHLASLARLQLTKEEKQAFLPELNAVLEMVELLNQVPTNGLTETAQVSGQVNIWREDKANQALPKKEALKNAPWADGDYFKVPKVL